MGEVRDNDGYEEELVDYEEEDQNAPNSVSAKPSGDTVKKLVSSVYFIYCKSVFINFWYKNHLKLLSPINWVPCLCM